MSVYFVTGIDTDVGKTYATALFARFLIRKGYTTITQKIAQTGCVSTSDDVLFHRKVMGKAFPKEDSEGTTCPYIFKYPASPHLSARLEGVEIDCNKISAATQKLATHYEQVVVEGVGGVYVPLNNTIALIDYLQEKKYKVVVVSSSKLGSINHTLLTLEALKNRNIEVCGLIYNRFADAGSAIANDSIEVFKRYLAKFGYPQNIVEIPTFKESELPEIDFSCLIM